MPTVSVIIPTYNRADAIGRTIDGVLAQSLDDIEVLIVDDASSDDTASVVESYDDSRVTLLRHETNLGGSAARNTGIEAANGRYVAFLDSDDEWHPRKLERQVGLLEGRGDDWVAVYCGVEHVPASDPGPLRRAVTRAVSRRRTTQGATGGEELVGPVLTDDLHTSAGSTLLVRADVVREIGGFDESFDRFQDSEFLIRVLRQGKLAYVNAPLVRRHESGDPSAAELEAADDHYLRTFSGTVRDLEAAGHDVLGAHHYMLGKAYLREGNVLRGCRFLLTARRPTVGQCPGLLLAFWVGLRRRLG